MNLTSLYIMKFSCNTLDLQKTLMLVSRAISNQQALPILGNLLIVAEGKRCTISATDLELSIISSIEADIENEGTITVPAKAFINFAQYNSDSMVVIESVNGNQLKCTSLKAKTVISGESATEYPTISAITKEHEVTLPAGLLLETLQKVTFAAAKTTLRPVLSGVYIQITNGMATFVATDSYRLSEYTLPITNKSLELECIVPSKVLEELKSVITAHLKIDTTNEEVEPNTQDLLVQMVVSSQQIELQVGKTKLLSRLIDGKFPNYKQIIPKETTTSVGINIQDFTTVLKRMHYFAKEMNNNITIAVSPEGMHMSTTQTQAGKDEATLSIELTGGTTKIALSSLYLLDFLSHIKGDAITMRLTDSMHPALFSLPMDENFLHLIMPLRLQEN